MELFFASKFLVFLTILARPRGNLSSKQVELLLFLKKI